MALNKTITKNLFGNNIEFNSYSNISNIEGNKDNLTVTINIYSDNTKQYLVGQESVNFVPSVADGAVNFIKQGYEYLKTLEEYADAVDC